MRAKDGEGGIASSLTLERRNRPSRGQVELLAVCDRRAKRSPSQQRVLSARYSTIENLTQVSSKQRILSVGMLNFWGSSILSSSTPRLRTCRLMMTILVRKLGPDKVISLSSLNHKQLKTPKIQSFRWLQFLHIFIREKFAKNGVSEKMEVWLRFCNICL